MPRYFPALALVSAIVCAACGDVTLKDPDVPDAGADAPDAREGTPDAREGEVPDAQPGTPDARPVSTPDARVPDAGEPGLPCVGGDAQRVDPDTGACYMLFTDARTWNGAVAACASLDAGTHLVAVTSSAENDLVVDLIAGFEAWLGATDAGFEGTFVWVTSDLVAFEAWADDEPNNGGTNGEDCAIVIGFGNRLGLWDDRGCGVALPYVCERE